MTKKSIGLLLAITLIPLGLFLGRLRDEKPVTEEHPEKRKVLARVRVDHEAAASTPARHGSGDPNARAPEGTKGEAEPFDFENARQNDTKKLTTVAEAYGVDKKNQVQVECDEAHCSYLFVGVKTDRSDDILAFLKAKGAFFLATVKSYQLLEDATGTRLDVHFFRDPSEMDDEKAGEEDRLSEVQKQMDEVKTKAPSLDALPPAEYLKKYLKLFIDQSVADLSLADIADYRIDCSAEKCELTIIFKEGTTKRLVDEHSDFVFLFIKQISVREKVKEYSMSKTDSTATYEFLLNPSGMRQ